MNKRKANKVIKKLTGDILDLMSSGSPLTLKQTMALMYGLPVRQKKPSPQSVYSCVSRMRRQGWLAKSVKNKERFYALTKKGRIIKLRMKLTSINQIKNGSSTLLIFDIPEEKRVLRDFLRRVLKQNGFTMIQKSVFVSSYVLPSLYYDLFNELNIKNCVKVFEGKFKY